MATKLGSGGATIDSEYGAFPSVMVGLNTIQTLKFRIGDVISSCVFDFDATIEDSYPGSGQVWANYERNPSDGSAQSAYDMNLGSASSPQTNDPTFNGSAGSADAYWSFDGGDLFQLAGSNTTFLNSLHKTTGGTSWTFAAACQTVDVSATFRMLNTQSSTLSNGITLQCTASEQIQLVQSDGSNTSSTSVTTPTSTSLGIGDVLWIFSYEESTGTVRIWINGVRAGDRTINFIATTTDAALALRFFTSATDGTRLYALSGFNDIFSDTEAAQLRALYRLRHSRNY